MPLCDLNSDTDISLRLLDDCPVGTGVWKPGNVVHEGIDVEEFQIINDDGPSKGSDNQLDQQTGGCWQNKFVDCFIHQNQTSNKSVLVQVPTGSAYMTTQVFNYTY